MYRTRQIQIRKKHKLYDYCKQLAFASARLPSQANQQILKLLMQDYKSFFEAMRCFKGDPAVFTGRPQLPHYKGELATAVLTNQICVIKDGHFLKLPKTKELLDIGPVKGTLKAVRIKAVNDILVVEAVMELPGAEIEKSNEDILRELKACTTIGRVVSIDPGLDNLCAVTNNFGEKPMLITERY